MSADEEGFMHIPRLLLIPLLISLYTAPIEGQSSSDTKPSQLLSALPQEGAQASVDRLRLPFRRNKEDLSQTMAAANGAAGHASFIIPPRTLPLPPLGQNVVCYCIRGYRVTRDDPESDSTRPAGYSTCQPAARFRLKDAGDSR